MKIISIWNPYATLIVTGHKTVETRSWPAPSSLIGQRIGIASTKALNREQKQAMEEPTFQEYYSKTGLPDLFGLHNGAILGTAVLHSCDPMTEEDLDDVTEEEQIYGWWDVGRWAWRLRDPVRFEAPVFTRGNQGIWDYELDLRKGSEERAPLLRRGLHLVKG